jgi:rieske iron-sulfur protein
MDFSCGFYGFDRFTDAQKYRYTKTEFRILSATGKQRIARDEAERRTRSFVNLLNKNRLMKNQDCSTHIDAGCKKGGGDLDANRRRLLNTVATSLVVTVPFSSSEAFAEPAITLLVEADAEENFKPLRPSDLAITKPLLAYPFDPKTGEFNNKSRLNKIVLVRLPEDKMTPETLARSASGVVAYSSICTHQGCDVKTWMSKESVLACYCHASKFNLFDGAKVVSGPAPSPLRAIPLKLEGEFLAIAASP